MSELSKFGRTIAFVAAVLLPVAASAQPPANTVAPPVVPVAPAAAAAPDSAAAEYVLGPEDVVEFDVVGTNDKARARIYTDGTIQTNLGGRILASGKTPRELAAEIAKTLKAGGFYSDPVVNLEVVGYASRYVTVLGSVGSPGLVPINRAYHLSEILARVGGVRGDGADFVTVRSEKGEEKRYIADKIASGDPSQDPIVSPGDKIFVPAAEIFYVSGQVKSPGSYSLRVGMTIAQAIAKAGGLSESGTDKKVKVRREGKNVKLKPDDLVQANDVLTIGERLF